MGAEARRGAASPPSVQAGTPGAGAPHAVGCRRPQGPSATSPVPGASPQSHPSSRRPSSRCPPRVSPDSGREVLRLAKKVSK